MPTPRHLLSLALAMALIALALPASAGAYVFWNTKTMEMQRVNPDGTGFRPDLIGDVAGSDIAANGRYLFFVTQIVEGPNPEELGFPVWARTNLDGGERIDLPAVPFNTEDIAVDEGHIYWEESGPMNGADIGRANLDGTDPEPHFLTDLPDLGQYFAVYGAYAYWTDRYADTINRVALANGHVDEEFVPEFSGAIIPEGPAGIAVDSEGIFWNYHEGQGQIGHAGLNGGGTQLAFLGPEAEARRGPIAIAGSDLYWLGQFGVAHAELLGGGASLIDRHFFDDPGETLQGGLAVNSASSPPIPAPPPPPAFPPAPAAPSGSTPPSTPAPLRSLPVPKVKLNTKAGTATLTLAVPGPGAVVLSGGGIKPLHTTAKHAGPLPLIVRPTAKAAAKLKAHGKLKVAPKLTFTPAGGKPISSVVSLTLKLG